jgi:predicted RNA-binding protein YlxR (DUF448 family)
VSVPERQCIGCGRRGPQSEFARLAVDSEVSPGRVVVVGAKEPHWGRGAYLCRRMACLDRAIQRKAFQRAFRASVVVMKDELAAGLVNEAGEVPGRIDGR